MARLGGGAEGQGQEWMKADEVSSFVQDFLDATASDQPAAASGASSVATGKKRKVEEELKADRKRERERRRRAEVGEKFDELTKVLTLAESALERTQAATTDEAGSRADVLQRTINALVAFTESVKAPSPDERTAAGGLLAAAALAPAGVADAAVQTSVEARPESAVVIVQTTFGRDEILDFVRSGKAVVTASPQLATAAAAAAASV
eukprot:CAMPEP_0197388418 /NCGR_PEP_ID=MMETSP1165-20131217/1070_1 /TAXON_ID=284809 /ORGANISM="Chrysocystis fragilis, Strain CCMP3189" /LENGTH=206 /DNA_ID=CAMNT_0042913765 /DNA_START=51 /DNA_END=668 /DNA_ORIENTATION=-